MKRKLLTEPQYRMLKRFSVYDKDGSRLGGFRDRAVAERLERLGCLEKIGYEPGYWRITDHGWNILDLHRSFFDAAPTKDGDR